MKYLLDTNVVSEGSKTPPNASVDAWLGTIPLHDIFLSVISIAEIRDGIERRPFGARRLMLEQWMNSVVLGEYANRILTIDVPIAQICGKLMAKLHQDKVRAATNDIWIAAIALHHDLTVATRNLRDFEHLGVPTINPWEFAG